MHRETLKTEEQMLFDNEINTNLHLSKILFLLGIISSVLIIVLQWTGVFIYYMSEAIPDIIAMLILTTIPYILTLFKFHRYIWFKYVMISMVVLMIPFLYLEYDYMALILWVFPLLISSMYFSNRLNIITVILDISVLGVTSYYRSYLRLQNNLISMRIGGLFKDFIISFLTYSILVLLSFTIIFVLTKKTNRLFTDVVTKNRYMTLSITDSLTGIYNHRYLMEIIENNRLLYETDGTSFCVALFDIDHFKRINDTYGHVVGDEVLKEVASTLRDCIRTKDIVGRYGGEEFMIIFPDTRKNDACCIAEECKKRIENLILNNIQDKVTISGGIDEYNGQCIVEYIRIVDSKLYRAKDGGRNLVISDVSMIG